MNEEIRHDATQTEQREGFAARFTRKGNIRLAGAAIGIALALLIAPGSRRLFLAQTELCLPTPDNVASIAGSQLGVRPDPFGGQVALRAASAAVERHPDDVQVQIAHAAMLSPDPDASSYLLRLQRLRALEGHFANSPSLYANILRYEALGEIRAHHDVEQYTLGSDPGSSAVPESAREMDAKPISLPAYAAYDRDAAAGERLDPDNAYFPFMRAIGLFGMRRDGEALEALSRASRKPQWREYYNDELKGQWKLQDEGFVNNSALFHSVSAMAILFPQYAQMRAAVRVTICAAIKAERAGNVRRGLELRESVVRLGSLMRVQSANLIGSLVGIALTDLAEGWPAGEVAPKSNRLQEKKGKEQRRQRFDAYLRRVHATSTMETFHAAQQAGDEIKAIVNEDSIPRPFDRPFTNLVTWWVMDLVTLSNILWLLVLGGIAGLCMRSPRLKAGTSLPGYARFALPLGLAGGALTAPYLLAGLSSYFMDIDLETRNWMLLAGFAPVLLLLALPADFGRERLRRTSVFALSLLAGAALTGFYFWQLRGITGIASLMQIYLNLTDASESRGLSLVAKLFWFTPYVSLLMLAGGAIVSRVCRIPLSVGLARGFRGLMVPIVAILFLIYGGMLLCTIRAEVAVQYGLERTLDNEGQYVADLSGKQWPPSDVAKMLVNHE